MRRLALLVVVAAMSAGCGGLECGPGTKADGDACVPVGCEAGKYLDADGKCVDLPSQTECGAGTVLDEATGKCVQKSCPEGQYLDATGKCVELPGQTECGPGTVLDEETGECVQKSCPEGQYLDATGTCVDLPEQTVCGAGTVLDEETGECVKITCPEGQYLDDAGTCVDLPEQTECGAGTVLDAETGECVPVCVAGTHQVAGSGACIPDSAACQSGQVWDNQTNQCVDVTGFCAEGTTWSAIASACVTDDSLLVADQYEGTGENDLLLADGTPESFTLPASGPYVIGGTVSAGTDKTGDGIPDPDFDFWAFEITRPTLIRISADGIGGTSAGFMVLSLDEELGYRRFGFGTTSDGAVRDVYLPKAGTYAIVASDAMNFLVTPMGGPAFGGPNYGYLITIEQLSVPTATELVLQGGRASAGGAWPVAVPISGTRLGFYEAQLEGPILYDLGLQSPSETVEPVLMLFDANGYLGEIDGGSDRRMIEAPTTLTMVADYFYSFGDADAAYTISIASRSTLITGDDLPKTAFAQPAWEADSWGELPWQFFTFEATAGEVLDVSAETVHGDTVIWFTDDTMSAEYGYGSGGAGASEHTANARFYATYSGAYVVAVLGLSSVEWGPYGNIERIPEQSLTLQVAISRRQPMDIGSVQAPLTLSAQALDPTWGERFFTMPAAAGEVYRLTVSSSDIFPMLAVYDTEVRATLTPKTWPSQSAVVIGGTAPLFGVAASGGDTQGTFDLVVTPVTVTDLGQLTAATPISVTGETMPMVSPERFFAFTTGAGGEVQIVVTPPADLDVDLLLYGPNGEVIGGSTMVGAGLSESFAWIARPGESVVFGVTGMGTLAADSTFDIEVNLSEWFFETEPNDDAASADLLDVTTPTSVYGDIDEGNRDWFKVELTAGGKLSALTAPFGDWPVGDTVLWLYAADGTEVAFNDDANWGYYSALNEVSVTAGTYYVVVAGYSYSYYGGYRLDVWFEEVAPPPPPTILGDITPGTPITSEISVAGELDWWRLTLTEAANIVVETSPDGASPVGDSRLWLYRAPDTQTSIAFDDDGGVDLYSRIDSLAHFGAPLAPGEYYVVVGGYGSAAGGYALNVTVVVPPPLPVESEPNDDAASANTLDLNVDLRAELSAGDSDWFAITTSVDGQVVTFETGLSESGIFVDTVITVYDQDGTTELGTDDDMGPGYFSRLTLTLPTAGTYYVKVTGYAASTTGAYMLRAVSY